MLEMMRLYISARSPAIAWCQQTERSPLHNSTPRIKLYSILTFPHTCYYRAGHGCVSATEPGQPLPCSHRFDATDVSDAISRAALRVQDADRTQRQACLQDHGVEIGGRGIQAFCK